MKRQTTTKPDSHSARVRASWLQHLEAQRASGLKQSEYCRAHGLQPKYFSLWKRRLADEGGAAAPKAAVAANQATASVPGDSVVPVPPLIPVTIKAGPPAAAKPKQKRGRPLASRPARDESATEALSIKARLPNGIIVDVFLPSRSLLSGFLSDLAGLAC